MTIELISVEITPSIFTITALLNFTSPNSKILVRKMPCNGHGIMFLETKQVQSFDLTISSMCSQQRFKLLDGNTLVEHLGIFVH